MTFVILCLEVEPVLRQHPLDLVVGKNAEKCKGRKVGIPAKGARGLSESDIEQFYSETQVRHEIVTVRLVLSGLGRPATSSAGRSAAGG